MYRRRIARARHTRSLLRKTGASCRSSSAAASRREYCRAELLLKRLRIAGEAEATCILVWMNVACAGLSLKRDTGRARLQSVESNQHSALAAAMTFRRRRRHAFGASQCRHCDGRLAQSKKRRESLICDCGRAAFPRFSLRSAAGSPCGQQRRCRIGRRKLQQECVSWAGRLMRRGVESARPRADGP